MMIDLSGKIALVTGAASEIGIGFASARRMAMQGAKLVLTDIRDEAVAKRAAELVDAGYEAVAVAHDVSDEASWKAAMDALVSTYGRLDIAVNNAGFAVNKKIFDMSMAEWHRQLRVNLDGVYLGTKAAIGQFRAQKEGGSIINIASVASLVGFPNATAYSASKGGVRLFSKAAAIECAAENIRVNTVNPGMIWSEIHEIAMAQDAMTYRANMSHGIIPLGRMGEADDIATMVAFLASNDANYITGADIAVDGGLTAM